MNISSYQLGQPACYRKGVVAYSDNWRLHISILIWGLLASVVIGV
jgi:hypothetical protein